MLGVEQETHKTARERESEGCLGQSSGKDYYELLSGVRALLMGL